MNSFPLTVTTKMYFSLTITRLCLDEKPLLLQQAVGFLLCPVLFPTSDLLADTNSALFRLFLIYSLFFFFLEEGGQAIAADLPKAHAVVLHM